MAMSEDTINNTVNSNNSSDSMALTDAQLVEYAAMNPFIIYLDGGAHVKNKSVVAALLEGVRPASNAGPNSIKVRKQGVRKGKLGYNARAVITDRRLVPVFALVEERLVDEMRVSPAALALGMAALNIDDAVDLLVEEYKGSIPDARDLVDCLVEEYVESAPIEREFFNAEPAVDTNYTVKGSYIGPESDRLISTLANESYTTGDANTQSTTEYAAADWDDIHGTVTLDHTTHPTNMFDGNYVGSTPPLVEAGVVADGELLDFNPEVHVIP